MFDEAFILPNKFFNSQMNLLISMINFYAIRYPDCDGFLVL